MLHDLATAAALTLAASVHCVGMCGGFVVAGGARVGFGARLLLDQLFLQAGKATSYLFLGALSGLVGAALTASHALRVGGRVLGVLTGLALIFAGLTLLGLLSRTGDGIAARLAPHLARLTGPLNLSRPGGSALLVGMALGFLPCPLVYAGLAAAAATGSAARGAAVLAGVALGTIPALTLVAAFGSFVPARARLLLARSAGVLLVVLGLWRTGRGLVAPMHTGPAAPTSSSEGMKCPNCP